MIQSTMKQYVDENFWFELQVKYPTTFGDANELVENLQEIIEGICKV